MKLTIEDFGIMHAICKAHGIQYIDLSTEKQCQLQLRMVRLHADKSDEDEAHILRISSLTHDAFKDMDDILNAE